VLGSRVALASEVLVAKDAEPGRKRSNGGSLVGVRGGSEEGEVEDAEEDEAEDGAGEEEEEEEDELEEKGSPMSTRPQTIRRSSRQSSVQSHMKARTDTLEAKTVISEYDPHRCTFSAKISILTCWRYQMAMQRCRPTLSKALRQSRAGVDAQLCSQK
jgi:hypothetical protein